MIELAVLFQAKEFLCWDRFPDLSIQLVPLQEAVAYYYPPRNNFATIVLFYQPAANDFSKSLFFLFHEAGHFVQWNEYKEKNDEKIFDSLLQQDRGEKKATFEKIAWKNGKILLTDFLNHHGIYQEKTINQYNNLTTESLATYY